MIKPEDIQTIPIDIQLMIFAGYCSYLIAFYGIRSKHKQIDIAFATFTFGIISVFLFYLFSLILGVKATISAFIAYSLTVFIAGVFRKWGSKIIEMSMRQFDLSHSTNNTAALDELNRNDVRVSQLAVLTKKGEWLKCKNLNLFSDEKYQTTIGADGSVIMYITNIIEKEGKEKTLKHTIDNYYGSNLTYIPKDTIERINMRYC